MQKETNQKTKYFIVAILFTGYLIGTMTHIFHLSDVIKLGFFNSAKIYGVHPVVNAYWLSLTIIDPIIAFLLIKKTSIGAVLCFVNILINVAVNSGLQIYALPTISVKAIYDSLGNIYNSLQIALLTFSTFTLPVIISDNKKYRNLFLKIPLLVLTIGLTIHLIGLTKVIQHFESFWVLWVHLSMIAIDGALMCALLNRLKLGYICGLFLFSSFGIIQAGYAGAIFMGFNCSFNLEMAVTISMCCVSFAALIMDCDKLTVSVRQIRYKSKP